MKKIIGFLFVVLCGFVLIYTTSRKPVSTEKKKEEKDILELYYLNAKDNGLAKAERKIVFTGDVVESAEEIIDTLKKVEPEEEKKIHPVSNKQLFINHLSSPEKGTVTIDFGAGYLQIDSRLEILLRAAIVKSLVQVKEITNVYFTVEGEPLTNGEGIAIGIMNDSTFILDNDKRNVYDTTQTVTLYYANQKGNHLVEVETELEANDNESMESAVIHALRYPLDDNVKSPLPADLIINRISVIQNICYVDFNEEIETAINGVEEEIKFFAIVNSLTSLERVSQVQITVGGEIKSSINGVYGLDRPLNCDYSYVVDK